jgi:uncharacterized paraquat-inducible protein A
MHDETGHIYCCPSCGKQLYKLRIMNHPNESVCERCNVELEPTGFYNRDMTKEKLNGVDEDTFIYQNFLYKHPKFNPVKHREYIEYLNSDEFKVKSEQEFQQAVANVREKVAELNKPKCPRCGSTQIQMVQRKWSFWTGFLTNKVDRVCVKCKHRW